MIYYTRENWLHFFFILFRWWKTEVNSLFVWWVGWGMRGNETSQCCIIIFLGSTFIRVHLKVVSFSMWKKKGVWRCVWEVEVVVAEAHYVCLLNISGESIGLYVRLGNNIMVNFITKQESIFNKFAVNLLLVVTKFFFLNFVCLLLEKIKI